MSGKTPDGSVLDVQICPTKPPPELAFGRHPEVHHRAHFRTRRLVRLPRRHRLYPESVERHAMTVEPVIDGIVKALKRAMQWGTSRRTRTPAGIRETVRLMHWRFFRTGMRRARRHDAGLIGVYPASVTGTSLRLAGNLVMERDRVPAAFWKTRLQPRPRA